MSGGSDFWSRRRAAVAAEQQAEAAAEAGALEAARQAEVEAQAEAKTDAQILTELGLPAPEDLVAGDDFKAFLTEAVPARLRRRALRALWRSNPVLANLDDLVDYADDYTDKAVVQEGMQTAYRVGKGLLRHIEAVAAEREETLAAAKGAEPEAMRDTDATALAEAASDPAPSVRLDPPKGTNPEPGADNPEDALRGDGGAPERDNDSGAIVDGFSGEMSALPTPPRRRMRFAFSDPEKD